MDNEKLKVQELNEEELKIVGGGYSENSQIKPNNTKYQRKNSSLFIQIIQHLGYVNEAYGHEYRVSKMEDGRPIGNDIIQDYHIDNFFVRCYD